MASHGSSSTWRGRALAPVLVYLSAVVAVISSLGAPLIPTIAAAEHVSLTEAQWSLTITLLVGAVATPAMGRMGDGPLRRATILGTLAIVMVGNVLAALPFGFGCLIVGRGLQGVGLGLIPLSIATARQSLPAHRSRSAIGLLSVTVVAGVGLGYPLTGLIAEEFGFHASFWFGAAVSAAALVAAVLVVPGTRHLSPRPLDLLSAVLFGTVLAGLLLVLSEGESWGWTSPALLGMLAASLVCLAVWITVELRTDNPLVNLRQLGNRVVLTAAVVGLIAGTGTYLLLSLVTRLAQTPQSPGHGFGVSIVVAGLILLPFSVGTLVANKVVQQVAHRVSWHLTLPLSCAVILASMLMFGLARTGLWELFAVMGVAGLGVGTAFALIPEMVVTAVPHSEVGSAIGFNQVLRYVGFTTGSALSAVVLESRTPSGTVLPEAGGYTVAAVLGVVICAAAIVTAIVLPGRRRSELELPATGAQPTVVGGSEHEEVSPAGKAEQVRG
ncbi:MFS transporter [Streptomyces sp. NPDC058691]|uniref:MFS transporter n=1 Tax=Streptomyces sp. NPDC058691 TaxID=3346601 RepID=UPI00365AB815